MIKKRDAKERTTGSTSVDISELRNNVTELPNIVKSMLNLRVNEENPKGKGSVDQQSSLVDHRKLKSISDIIANSINANVDLKKITPYIRKAEIIWKTLLLSPNGFRKSILEYDTNNSSIKNSKLHDELLKVVQEYYTNDYKIEKDLPEMVKDMLIGTGSYVRLHITRPALDQLINGGQFVSGMESFEDRKALIINELGKEFTKDQNLGLLAKNKGLVRKPSGTSGSTISGLEDLFTDNSRKDTDLEFPLIAPEFKITMTDNLNCLMINSYRSKLSSVQADIDGMEGFHQRYLKLNKGGKKENSEVKKPGSKIKKLSAQQQEAIDQLLDKDKRRNYAAKNVDSLRNPGVYSQKPYGNTLKFHIASEATIPLYANGDFNELIGVYILIGEQGEFLKSAKDYQGYENIKLSQGSTNTGAANTDTLINNLKKIHSGDDCDFDMSEFVYLAKTQLEKELDQAILSGTVGAEVSVELEESVLKIFLCRALQQKRTRVLFVPACYVSYMAFEKNRMGIGESLTTQAKDFIARLAAIDVADAIAQLDNAQTINELVISLEAQDTDPDSTIAMARQAWFRNNPTVHNLVSSNILSSPVLVDALREQSLLVRVEANDNKFVTAPQTSMNQIERTSFRKIDSDSRDHLLNSIANTFCLPKSWLDDQDENSNNFKVEALAEQDMLRNQTVMYQAELAEMLSSDIRKHIMLSEVVLNRLINTINDAPEALRKPDSKEKVPGDDPETKCLQILKDFITNLYVAIPPPATMEQTTKIKEKMDVANEWAEKVVAMSATKAIMEPLIKHLGLDPEKIDSAEIESQFKAIVLFKAYRMFNVPTPFDEIVNKGKEGGMYSLLNDLDYFNENVGAFITEYLKQTSSRYEELKKKLPKDMVANEYDMDSTSDDPLTIEDGETGTETEDDFDLPPDDVVEEEPETEETEEESVEEPETEEETEEEEVTEEVEESTDTDSEDTKKE